jgi:hypothetical protein
MSDNGLGDIGALLSYIGRQNAASTPNFAPVRPGMTSSLISGAFSPETMFASGSFSPQALQGAIDSTYQQLLNQYNQELSRITAVPFEATFGSLSINSDQLYAPGTEIGELMRDAVNSIALGQATAADALQAINTGISNGSVPADVASYIGKIGDDLKRLEERELPSYRQAIQKYQYDAQQKLANAGLMEPTRQDARMKVYSDLGVPQMALLPDPTEQFQLDPYMFLDPKKVSRYQGMAETGTQQMADIATRNAADIQRRATQGEEISMRNRRDVASNKAVTAAERAKQEYLSKNIPKDDRDLISKGLDFLGGNLKFGLGDLFGGDKRKKELERIGAEAQKRYDMVYQQTMNKEMGKYKPKTAERVAMESILATPDGREAVKQKFVGEAVLRVMAGGNAPRVAKAQTFLANAGITPYSQAMNQILLNAQAAGTKPRK